MKHQLHRLTALLLALAMTLSLASTSLATNVDSGDSSTSTSADTSVVEDTEVSENQTDTVSDSNEPGDQAGSSTEDDASGESSPVGNEANTTSKEEAPSTPSEVPPPAENQANAISLEEDPADPEASSSEEVEQPTAPPEEPTTSVTVTVTIDKDGKLYCDDDLYSGLYRENEDDLLYLVEDGEKTLYSGRTIAESEDYETYLCGSELFDEWDDLYYFKGEPYTGLFRFSSTGYLWYVKDGNVKGTAFSGQATSSYTYICNYVEQEPDDLFYYEGGRYTGLFRFSETGYLWYIKSGKGGTKFTGQATSSYTYICNYVKTPTDSLYYYNGCRYTGLFRFSDTGYLWYIDHGQGGTKFTGQAVSSPDVYYICNYKRQTPDGLYYYEGCRYTGLFRFSETGYLWYIKSGKGGTKFSGQATSSYTYICNYVKTPTDSLYYYNGCRYTGLFRFSAGGRVWVVNKGVGGTTFTGCMTSAYTYICNYVKTPVDNANYVNGVRSNFTGVASDMYYYSKGVRSSTTGWVTVSGKVYHLTKGKADTGDSTGFKYIKGPDGTTYKYKIRSDGSVVTDMFAYDRTYMSKKLLIVFSRKTTTGTILAWASDANGGKGGYVIPCKSFVISMSGEGANETTFVDGTYSIKYYKDWFQFARTGYWFHYCCSISGSHILTHTTNYKSNNIRTFVASKYNSLGVNNSAGCSRMQAVNAKLIVNLVSSASSIRVKLSHTSTSDMPFGRMTLSNNFDRTGKISSSMNYDPTDPAINSKYKYA